MSSNILSISAAEIFATISVMKVGKGIVALLLYDWIICLGQEVSLNGTGTAGAAGPLSYMRSVAIRYSSSVCNIRFQSCNVISRLQMVASLLSLLAPCLFSTMRVYAMSAMNVYLATITLVLSVIPVITNLIQDIVWFQAQNLPLPFSSSFDNPTPQRILTIDKPRQRGVDHSRLNCPHHDLVVHIQGLQTRSPAWPS
ncbi:hypothetical protein BD311DRAFT_126335 [Dichomitus squalens]|uniref:Uncharacterized protein n=1 Tax=Dichomitus squalens TaxID=114155 RepID=A0A4Q9MAN6_9APHY|nr:hypothetical protein BD311DRAFT_126335 [Dichomitus squalens]